MQLTRAADYAARVMIHLAGLPADSRASRNDLAAVTSAPLHFLGKILQSLVRSGLIHSQRGASGGFTLARAPGGITLVDVIEAIEGPLFLNSCINPGEPCVRSASCAAHKVWAEAQTEMLAVLKRASILDLAKESARLAADLNAPGPCALDTRKPGGLALWN